MSDSPSPFSDDPDTPFPYSDNPYSSPQAEAGSELPPDVAAFKRKPGGFIAICIMSILLGMLGLLAVLSQVIHSTVGAKMQQEMMSGGSGGLPDKMRKAQDDMAQSMQGLTNRFKIVNLTFAGFQAILSGGLLVGGILCLKLKPAGRKLLIYACVAALLFESGKAIPQVMLQLEMEPIMEKYMTSIMEDASQGNNPIGGMASIFAKVLHYLGIAITIGWLIAKLIFFVIAMNYLKRPRTMALFAAGQASHLEPPPIAAQQ